MITYLTEVKLKYTSDEVRLGFREVHQLSTIFKRLAEFFHLALQASYSINALTAREEGSVMNSSDNTDEL